MRGAPGTKITLNNSYNRTMDNEGRRETGYSENLAIPLQIQRLRYVERNALRDNVPRLALKTPFRNGTLRDIAMGAVQTCSVMGMIILGASVLGNVTSTLGIPEAVAAMCEGGMVADVIAAVDYVIPTVEVIDSRYENFKFDLISVVADNASSTRFITGGQMANVADLDLRTLGVVMEKNGEVVELGAGAAVLGHPASSAATPSDHTQSADRSAFETWLMYFDFVDRSHGYQNAHR